MEGFGVEGILVTIVLLALFSVLLVFLGVQIVPDGSGRIVERLGRRHRVLMPGVNIIIPVLDRIKKGGFDQFTVMVNGGVDPSKPLWNSKGDVSLAEQRMDPKEDKYLAKDNSEIWVDTVAYFRLVDPMKAVYDVAAFQSTFVSLIVTTLRQEVGRHDGDTIITARDSMSENLRSSLQEASTNWGIEIFRVEIENIRFNSEVAEKLSEARENELLRRAELVAKQAEAEQQILLADAEKKSVILKAEGEKEAAIKSAEGSKQAQILIAQGQFEQEKLQAEGQFLAKSREKEGEAQGFAAIAAALAEDPNAIVALESLRAQERVAESLGKSSNTLIVPSETAGLFGAAASIAKGYQQLVKK
jgi:regulator of protease activity HflC (stomatin/prohibitin superfamily)